MSGVKSLPLIGSLFAGSGAATAGTAGAAAIPDLLAGAALSQGATMPGIFAAAPAATSAIAPAVMGGATSFAPMTAGGTALQEAIGLTHGPAMANGAFFSQGDIRPIGPLQASGEFYSRAAMPDPNATPAWVEALRESLKKSADVSQMMMKHQAANRLPNAPAPNFYIPANVPKPQIGGQPPAVLSPMQRFAMLSRRV